MSKMFRVEILYYPSLQTCSAPKQAPMRIALNTLLASNRTPSSAPFPASISGPDLPGLCPAPSGSRDWAPGPCHWTRMLTRIDLGRQSCVNPDRRGPSQGPAAPGGPARPGYTPDAPAPAPPPQHTNTLLQGGCGHCFKSAAIWW